MGTHKFGDTTVKVARSGRQYTVAYEGYTTRHIPGVPRTASTKVFNFTSNEKLTDRQAIEAAILIDDQTRQDNFVWWESLVGDVRRAYGIPTRVFKKSPAKRRK